ncbi:MAG: agarase [Planctomycetota bacterium]
MCARFFAIAQRGGHWWFITPEGEPFFSLGMNHIDSATLRYPENVNIWRETYANDQRRWIREAVAPDLKFWGFNTIGWVQEVVLRGETMHRHSRNWTFEEYQWADMPYCHLLPFIESHQWEIETRLPDVFHPDFSDWCDYVARDACARMADDPKLIGYFYVDCPTWVHSRKPDWKRPLFDPDLLKTEAGRRQLFDIATLYYQTTHDAIRRYDPNHLILGDRYEARAPLPDEVVKAAVPYVDVLSFQYFSGPEDICRDFTRWHELTGLPILLADACTPKRDGTKYPAMLHALRELPCCVGWHYCGAYLRNRARKAGFRDEQEHVDEAFIETVRQANAETHAYVQEAKEAQV